MKSVSADTLLNLLEANGLEAVKDIRKKTAELEAQASVAVAMKEALAKAAKYNKSKQGSETFQTLLTAVAHEGDEYPTMTTKRKAAVLGVREQTLSFARQRLEKLRADLHPDEAIRTGAYWYVPRARRSDATSPELLSLMRQFWHTDEVSRASGNSADRDMWKASKSPDADCHPRR